MTIATGEKEIIKRRQELPKTYFRDGSVYITKTKVIKKGSFLGDTLAYMESHSDFYVNIDTPDDWLKTETKLPLLLNRI